MNMIIKPMNSDLTFKSGDERCFFKTFKAGDYTIGLVQCFDKQGEIHQKIGVADGFEPDVINDIIQNGVDYALIKARLII